jgi:hypothetical protein
VLVDGELLYVCTSNGVDWEHRFVLNPSAPSLIALHKRTGKLAATDDMQLGPDIIHGQWCSPSMGVVNGKKEIFFGTGTGYVFGFAAPDPARLPDHPVKLKTIWKLNGHPLAQTQDHIPVEHIHDSHSYEVIANPVFSGGRLFVPVVQEPFHSMPEGWLLCIDAAKTGDITRSGIRWSFDCKSTSSTAAVADGLVYLPNQHGKLFCLDAGTGRLCWTLEVGPRVWGSPLVADGKVYLGTGGRPTLWVIEHGRQLKVKSQIRMRSEILNTPVAANGVLYVATWRHLYAIRGDAKDPQKQNEVAAR